jgi:hypothetical protein
MMWSTPRGTWFQLGVVAGLLTFSRGVWAQSVITGSIAGVVKDATGAVLPGVTVEAASPALIEKVRTVATDEQGNYKILDLRPGTYTVTFSLVGFSTVKREGIELSGAFDATINVDMKVGGVSETITVSGETPIVDVQSVRRQQTLTNETLTSIPLTRSWAATAVLIPGIVAQTGSSLDIQVSPNMVVFGGAGGRANEGRMQVDGLNTGAALNGGGVSTYIADVANMQEVVTTTSGGLGEAEVGGPTIQFIPKSGGNTVKGAVFLSGTSSGMVSSNYTPALQAAGLSTPGAPLTVWDYTGGVGGPIKQDRLWYYATLRDEGETTTIPGIYPNQNAGVASAWLYSPDKSIQAQGAQSFLISSVRLTFQATDRNKFNLHWDLQEPCNGSTYSSSVSGCRSQPNANAFVGAIGLGGLTATTSPETSGYLHILVQNKQFTWSSPVTNKLLLEAGVGDYSAPWGPYEAPGNPTANLVRVTDIGGAIPGLIYRSANWANDYDNPNTWRATASYLTGGHTLKFGYIGGFLVENLTNYGNTNDLSYTFNNGVPISLTQNLMTYTEKDRVRYDALYAQDQWTLGRVTLQGALRFDHAWSYTPPQTIPATVFLQSALNFPETPGVNYKDLSPRGGLAWDIFGTGKTSVKVNFGRYEDPASNFNDNYSISDPIARIATTSTRSWTPTGTAATNPNYYIPQCNLLSNSANGQCGAGTAAFGTPNYITAGLDPNFLNGWGVRPNDWQIGASVQQELMPRVSIEVGYFRRWLDNFTATDNQAETAANFTPFSITAPTDPRLPGGGGYTISGLSNLAPQLFGVNSNYVTNASNFGTQYQHYDGVLFNITARPRSGLTIQGGINSGKTTTNNCAVLAVLPGQAAPTGITGDGLIAASTTSQTTWCNNSPGFITKINGIASYIVPKIDVLLATTLRSDQGAPLQANWNASTATVIAPAVGRSVAGGTTTAINLIAPGAVWGDRVNEFDIRVAKVLKFGRVRTNVGIDVYNVLNSNAILTYNQTFNATAAATPSGAWLAPTSVLTPRFLKISAQIDF